MQDGDLYFTDEELSNLSVEQLAELKVEMDDTSSKLNDLINDCNDALNS